MPTDPRSTPTLVQADTLLATETPNSLVDAGNGAIPDPNGEPRYAGGALLGQGGMGEVRLYRDRRLGREVAVKVLRVEDGPFGVRRMRFVREARVQGQLEHPSVVPVYDLDETPEGEARITMKRVRGHTLESVLAGLATGDTALARRFTRRRLLTAFVSVCRALEYAHTRGVVHRDVKPANVMLGDFGEVHVLDWGIARVAGSSGVGDIESGIDSSTAETMEQPAPKEESAPSPDPGAPRRTPGSDGTAVGAILGTPAYMSPEQARGRVDLIDARSDVFALGAMLFEILTLTPMLTGRSAHELLSAARSPKEARSPAVEHPESDVPPELDEAVRRATSPEIGDRYSSAGALAEAVDRYLDGDRDMAARRALAGEQLERARDLLKSGEGPSEQAETRAAAVRTLARAVALDPHHEEASAMLGQLLVETPRELPKEAAAELSAARDVARKTAAWGGVYRIVGVFVLTGLGAWMGVRRTGIGILSVTALFAASLLSMTWLRSGSERAREVMRLATLASSIVALTAMSYALGPAFLVPTLAMVNGFVLLGQADFRSARVVIVASTIPVWWRFALGVAGAAEMPYEVTPDRVVIPASLVGFPPVLTLLLLLGVSLLQVAAPLTMMSLLRERLRSLEERLFLHSYHLRQLATSARREPPLSVRRGS
ncbi:MAG: protein kinase [Polyangiaceae bacterium]